MGFMDKVKDSVKSADEKLGNAIDKEKLDSDEELRLELYDKIKECEVKIADLKAQKESIGKKEE